MNDFFSRHRTKFIALILLVTPLILLASASDDAGWSGGWLRAPAHWIASGVGGLTDSVGEAWDGLVGEGVEQENERLHAQNARLREEKARLIGVLQENARLRRLVGFKKSHPEFEVLPARVIARDTTPYFRVVTIEVIADEDVELAPRMPVVVAGGVVGQVHAVLGPGHAEVMVLSDPRSRIDAISQRNRAHGIVQGLGHEADYRARISYLSEKDEVRTGDTMVTSGMGGVFPQELIVGTVAAVATDERGLFQTVEITPAVDLSRVSEVFIITSTVAPALTGGE